MSHNPYQSPPSPFADPPLSYAPAPRRHSGLGIASFALAVISGGTLFAMIGAATYFAASMQERFNEQSAPAIVVGLGVLGGMGLAAVGAALGLAGILQPNRNKVFAILGLTFNLLVFVGVCGLLGLGLAAG